MVVFIEKDFFVAGGAYQYLITFLFLVAMATAAQAEIYKYKDKYGKTVFSDVKPTEQKQTETVELKTNNFNPRGFPIVEVKQVNQQFGIFIHNLQFAPLHVFLSVEYMSGEVVKKSVTLKAGAKRTVLLSERRIQNVEHGFSLGELNPEIDSVPYTFPVSGNRKFHITQSFNGVFSHKGLGNRHAVDIAMPVGTDIVAAREGVVIWAKDDYHMGGARNYFLDKANYVSVLHDDGSFAVYAHLLLGSAVVKPGQRVERGQKLGRSGSSGFSTGPHLHFVIRQNVDYRTRTVPFKFILSDGKRYTPEAGMVIKVNSKAK